MSRFKNALLAAIGLLVLSDVLLLTQRTAVQAQSPGGSLANLITSVNALRAQLSGDETKIAALQSDNAALLAKTASLSVSGTDLTFTGVNVHIVSGSGATDDGVNSGPGRSLTGLGNLIIGYDAPNVTQPAVRTGSHNLVVGDQNSYSSFGGLVAGIGNAVTGSYATVSGGTGNTAGGSYASVSGGENNAAGGRYASVSGGRGNAAGGIYASVSGGISNTASGAFASVTGGTNNAASGTNSSIGGGELNTAITSGATVGGGYNAQTATSDGWSAGVNQAGIPGFKGNFVSP